MSFVLYDKAKKMGAKAYKRAVADGRYPFLPVLDDIIDKDSIANESWTSGYTTFKSCRNK